LIYEYILVFSRFVGIILVALWTCEFITALGKLALSHCFSGWYFTPEKDVGHHVRVSSSLGVSILYHAGTAASGSLLIKPIIVMRSPFLLLQTCIKKSGMDNSLIDGLICCCQCCLFVLERFLKFASKHAYLHTATFGTTFWKSSHEAYYLRRRHSELIGQVGPISLFSVIYTKLFITVGVTLGSHVLLDIFYIDSLNSIIAVTTLIAFLTSYISEIFTDVLGEAVSTIIYCYIADEEIMGSEGAQYSSPELDEFLNQIYDEINRKNKLAMAGADIVFENDIEVIHSSGRKNVDIT
jgi:hypothetical protein